MLEAGASSAGAAAWERVRMAKMQPPLNCSSRFGQLQPTTANVMSRLRFMQPDADVNAGYLDDDDSENDAGRFASVSALRRTGPSRIHATLITGTQHGRERRRR